ncbi:MAG: T9SS C-terminal target domain-containing protein [Saprospirales bacterium]|nr:MAG: T9SS C-terminal target domain-containing protein [Saprospirales bacterium]
MKFIILLFITFLFLSNDLFSQWERMNDSPITARHHPVTFTLDNTAYLISGTTSQSSPLGTKDFYRYDEESDTWIRLADFPGSARSFAYAVTYDGKAYFGFGSQQQYLNDLWEFDPETENWTQLASCPCNARSHPAFVALDGKIYMGFGNNNFNLNDWWVYDIEENGWEKMPDVPGPPRHHPFHFAAGGYVYAGFGHAGPNYYDDWYRFDPNEQEWTRMNDHPSGPRVAGQEFQYGGYGFVISGDGQDHFNLTEGEFYRYLHETDEWERLPNHPGSPPDGRVGRWAPGSFVLNDHVYFFGGVNRGGGFLYSEVWRFDLSDFASNTAEIELITDIEIFPNPTAGIINLVMDNELMNQSSMELSIYDVSGKQVYKESGFRSQIDASFLSSGKYFLKVSFSEHLLQTIPFNVVQ